MTGISKSTVHRWTQTHAVLMASRNDRRRFTKWREDLRQLIDTYVSAHPFCTLNDVRDAIRTVDGVVAPKSLTTVSTWLRHRLDITRKRACGKYVVDNDKVRTATQAFKLQMQGTDPNDFLSIDEASVYFSEATKYGYTRRGQPLRVRAHTGVPHHVRKRVTVLMAVSAQGVVHYDVFEGSCNTLRFAAFVRGLQSQHRYALLDNVAFHKSKDVRNAFREAGITPVYIPPYSPQFNPIEHVFAALKQRARHAVALRGSLTDDALRSIIETMSVRETMNDSVSNTSVPYAPVFYNTFAHCWRVLQDT